jgi:hypothetical protein
MIQLRVSPVRLPLGEEEVLLSPCSSRAEMSLCREAVRESGGTMVLGSTKPLRRGWPEAKRGRWMLFGEVVSERRWRERKESRSPRRLVLERAEWRDADSSVCELRGLAPAMR